MINKKDLELKLLLRESHIQQLNLKVEELEDKIIDLENKNDIIKSKNSDLKANLIGIKRYVKNNYQYVDDVMKQYFDMILYIIKIGE